MSNITMARMNLVLALVNTSLAAINVGLFIYSGRAITFIVGIFNLFVAALCFWIWRLMSR